MKIIKHINIIIIVMLLIASALLVGTPVFKSNVYIVYIASGVFSIGYFIKKILKKEKIEISQTDVMLIILTASTIIPLICKNYVTLEGTINILVQYICILNLYIITKGECKKEPKYVDVIVNTIIISILILSIIGIDEITNNYFKEFKFILKYKWVELDEQRLGSLFSYPNAMAVIGGMGVFLSIGYIYKSKTKKMKIIYGISSTIMLITMLLTYSRLVYILFAIMTIVYLLILGKKHNINNKITKKRVIIISTIMAISIVYIIVGLNISTKVDIEKDYQKIMYSVEPKETYNFVFDIESTSKFTIKFTEKNKYFDDIKVTQMEFEACKDKKKININIQEETKVMYINIENKEKNAQLTIYQAYLNDKELILKYKLLPTKIIQKIEGISFKNKSVWERMTFIKDGINIIKENWLLGLGGNAWETIQSKVQSYNYYAQEMHSFPIKVFIENGILGFIACICIGIFIIKKCIQELRKDNLDMCTISIIIALILLLLHSLLDFDLSFFYICLVAGIMLAILSVEERTKKIKQSNIMYLILIIGSIFSIYVSSMQMYYIKDTEMLRVNSKRTEEKIYKNYCKLLPFKANAKQNYYQALNKSGNTNYKEIDQILQNIINTEKYNGENINLSNIYKYLENAFYLKEDIQVKIEKAYDYITNTEEFYKYNPYMQFNRIENLKNIIELLNKNNQEFARKFQEQYVKEITEKEKYILDYEKSRYKKEEVGKYKEYLDELK